jgi:hypothetical protein
VPQTQVPLGRRSRVLRKKTHRSTAERRGRSRTEKSREEERVQNTGEKKSSRRYSSPVFITIMKHPRQENFIKNGGFLVSSFGALSKQDDTGSGEGYLWLCHLLADGNGGSIFVRK